MLYHIDDGSLDEDAPLVPSSPYGMSKLAQDQLALRAATHDGLDVVVARPFNHIGPRQTAHFAVGNFAHQLALIEAGRLPPVLGVGNLDALRDLMDVRDTARAYRALMRAGTPGRAYNVCAGRAIRMRDLLDGLLQHATVQVDVRVDPDKFRPVDQPIVLGSFERLSRETGWHPEIPMDRTLGDLLDYWRGQAHA
jgi:GDP-4-dehydro-6-deoxy-D-mannose reductase